METLMLEALPREATLKAKYVRSSGRIPAVYYGRGQKNLHLALEYQVFRKLFDKAGENTVLELNVDGKKYPVLVHDVQYDPVSDNIAHVDFIHVDMTKEVTTSVKVVIVGVSPAVKNMAGILDVQKHELKIRCLPKDLIHSVEVDVSSIADFHTSIRVKDVQVPSTIKLVDNPEDTVVTATPPRAEEETKPAEAAPAEGEAAAGAAAGGAAGSAPAAGAAAPQGGAKEAKK